MQSISVAIHCRAAGDCGEGFFLSAKGRASQVSRQVAKPGPKHNIMNKYK